MRIPSLPPDAVTWTGAEVSSAMSRYRAMLDGIYAQYEGDPDDVALTASDQRAANSVVSIIGDLKQMMPAGLRLLDGSVTRDFHPSDHGGGGGSMQDGPLFGRLRGIGDQWVTNIGAAIDGTAGGTMVSPFYVSTIAELPQRNTFI